MLRRVIAAALAVCLLFPSTLAAQSLATRKPEKPKISEREAEELFHSIDEMMRFASQDSHLPIQQPVKSKLVDRATVEADVSKRLREDEDASRLERSAVVLKKFGFLPHDFQLRDFMISMMTEQVAGYYNLQDKTMYLLDWVELDNQKPIMAHELTHALQDQKVGLQTWDKPKDDKGAQPDNDSDPNDDARSDEQLSARLVVLEGQATVVLEDYVLADYNLTVTSAPARVEAFKERMTHDSSPIYHNAPPYLRESLIFPYREGLTFMQTLLFQGRKAAFEDLLAHPPKTTREILHPEVYIKHEADEPRLPFPKLGKIFGDAYRRYDAGSMGEFDVNLFLKQFAGDGTAASLAPHARGGIYYGALDCHKEDCKSLVPPPKKDTGKSPEAKRGAETFKDSPAPAHHEPPTSSLGLIYVSRWDSAANASRFAATYAKVLSKRFKSVQAEAAAAASPSPERWQTDEGIVDLSVRENIVLAIESFDPATTEKIRSAFAAAEATP